MQVTTSILSLLSLIPFALTQELNLYATRKKFDEANVSHVVSSGELKI